MPQPDRPLPDCLTRLLRAPASRSPRTPALEGAVVWALVCALAGLVWLGIAWQALRWLTR